MKRNDIRKISINGLKLYKNKTILLIASITISSIILLTIEILFIIFIIFLMIHRRKIFDKKAIIFVVPTFFIIFSIYLIGFLNFNNGITTLNFYKLIVASLKSFAFDTKTELISKSLENTLYYFVYCLGIGIAALSTAFSQPLILICLLVVSELNNLEVS